MITHSELLELVKSLVDNELAGYGEYADKCLYCHNTIWQNKKGEDVYRHDKDCPVLVGRKAVT